jgi:hypothetical protein
MTALFARFALTQGMKDFLGKFGLPLLILIALGLAVVAIDQRGYNRAKEQDRKADLERQLITADVVRSIDATLDDRLRTVSAKLAGKIQTIDTEGKTVVQPILTRELVRDPSLADPSRCLSPGLLNAVNAARGFPADGQGAGGPAALADPRSGYPRGVPAGDVRH